MLAFGDPARAAIIDIVAPRKPRSANTDSAAARMARSLTSRMLDLAKRLVHAARCTAPVPAAPSLL